MLWDGNSRGQASPDRPSSESIAARDSISAPDDPRLRRVIDHVDRRLAAGKEISLADLARVAGLSPHHLAHVFRRATGSSPYRYVIERRVARAAELLIDPSRSICQVAYEVGFSSQSHLTYVFRRYYRTTPAAYRRSHRQSGPKRPGLEPGCESAAI